MRFVCLLALVACAPLAHAQQHVYRCIGTHGEPVFSGQPCGTPAPQPGQTAGTQAIATGGACAASPQALRQDIARAVAKHDANRMAGLILWRGMDQASAQATLRGLSTWLQQPLAGIAIDYAHDPPSASAAPYPPAPVRQPATASSAPVQPPIGFEVSTGGGDGSTRSFGVTEFGGCWWLTF
ncbi:MAG: hypothetical protein EPN36_03085 [Rhodanobacteraceae bacterium]|nr:MAG: hypothetical protein EPN36_03085 [Rhodanobacteraceae bacterium]